MDRPIESNYNSHVAYTRALEAYCDSLAQPEQDAFGYWFADTDLEALSKGWFVKGPSDGKLNGVAGIALYTRIEGVEHMTKEALKLALEIALEKEYRLRKTGQSHMIEPIITAIKEALAQDEQEPVAWISKHDLFRVSVCSPTSEDDKEVAPGQRLTRVTLSTDNHSFFGEQPLYTTPPKRPWVGLTDEKVKEIWLKGKDHGDDWLDVLALARSFEAELKEKNT